MILAENGRVKASSLPFDIRYYHSRLNEFEPTRNSA